MLLVMLKLKMPINAVVFVDLGYEHAEVYEHIDLVEKRTGCAVVRLNMADAFSARLTGADGLKAWGWPSHNNRWCTGMKVRAIREYAALTFPGDTIVHYIGIASDEAKRMSKQSGNVQAPLIKFRMDEAAALDYCKRQGYRFGGHYDRFNRASCWLCPLQSVDDLYALYHHKRQAFNELVRLEAASGRHYPIDLGDAAERFERYDNGLSPRYRARSRCSACVDNFVSIGHRK